MIFTIAAIFFAIPTLIVSVIAATEADWVESELERRIAEEEEPLCDNDNEPGESA